VTVSHGSLRTIIIGFILLLFTIFLCTERGAARSVPSLPSNNSQKVVLLRKQDLSFGGVIAGLSTGTIVVKPNGQVDYAGGIMRNYHSGVPVPHPAELSFTLYNPVHCHKIDKAQNDDDESTRTENDDAQTDDDRTDFTRHGLNIHIFLPSSSTLKLGSDPSEGMKADHFVLDRTKGAFTIGATLHVGALQKPGVYSGTFEITVILE